MTNSITISGAIIADPELRFLDSGAALTELTVSVVTGKKKDGEQYAPSALVNVTCWNSDYTKLAENVAESYRKGDRVLVVGKIVEDRWEDKDTGAKRSKLKVTAFEVAADTSYAVVKVAKNERTDARSTNQSEPSF